MPGSPWRSVFWPSMSRRRASSRLSLIHFRGALFRRLPADFADHNAARRVPESSLKTPMRFEETSCRMMGSARPDAEQVGIGPIADLRHDGRPFRGHVPAAPDYSDISPAVKCRPGNESDLHLPGRNDAGAVFGPCRPFFLESHDMNERATSSNGGDAFVRPGRSAGARLPRLDFSGRWQSARA